MAQDNEIKLQIGVETDESSIARAKRSIDGLEGSVKDVANEIKKAGNAAGFDEVASGATKAENAVESLGKAARNTAAEIEAATKAANDQFDKTSQGVGLAGDAESNLRTLGGAAGAFGNQGIEQGVGAASEVFAVIEAAPRLKEAFAGLPATIGAAVTALGPVGLAFAAVGVGLVALVSVAQKGTQDLKRAARERLAAEAELVQSIAGGLTTQDAQSELAYLQELQKGYTELVVEAENERKAAFERAVSDAGGLDVSGRLREAFGLTESGEIDTALTERKDLLAETTARINELNQALGDGSLAANDAKAAEEELANAREEAGEQIIEQARAAGELVALQSEINDLTEEELAQREEQLRRRIAQTEAELAALQQLNNGSETVANQIKNLEQSLSFLGDQLKLTTSETSKATAAANTQRKKAQEDQESARRESRTQQRQSRQTRSRSPVLDQVRREIDERKKAQEQIAKTIRDYNNREANELVRHQQKLEDIRLNAQRAERDALRSGDIFALRDIRERASDQFTDAGRDFQFNQGMRAREFAQSNNNVTFNITNADPQAVAYQIQRQLAGTLR